MTRNTNKTSNYTLVCGMEVHAELKTASKMFCGCKNDPFGAEKPNIHTCPVCLGMPGGIPVANKKAIEWTIKLGLALGCKINLFSKFDRKHYFYPDLAKGYQISQYDLPFCYDGVVETSEGPVRIRRIHLEEDTGKLQHKTISIHNAHGTKQEKVSLVDFNRSGVPLVEIVTEADIVSATQAKEYGKKLRQIMRFLDIADCDMDQGGMRLEANVSLRTSDSPNPVGVTQDETNLPNYKVELKNINSFRFLEQAIEFEINRQSEQLDSGKTPAQETRGWDSTQNISFSQRTKEDAEDYRYFPDPDIPPIRFTTEQIEEIKAELPELPDQVATRWNQHYNVALRYSDILITNQEVVAKLNQAFEILSADSTTPEPDVLASDLVNKKISVDLQSSATTSKTLVATVTQLHKTADVDEGEIAEVVSQVMEENPGETERFKAGETKLLNFFIGQTMRKLGKKVDVEVVKKQLHTAT